MPQGWCGSLEGRLKDARREVEAEEGRILFELREQEIARMAQSWTIFGTN